MSARSVLVTGASTGIGAATVQELVRRGFHVWATVRKPADAQRLSESYGDKASPLLCDITNADQIAAVGDRVRGRGALYGLVNNAGVAIPAPLELVPIDEFRRQLEINIVGQLAMIQAVLPCLRETRGRIVNVGSVAGRIAGPLLGPYHTSKFGLLGLTDTLRSELTPVGVKVILVEPGAIATPIWSTGAATGDQLMASVSPQALAPYQTQIGRSRARAARSGKHGRPPSEVALVIADALTRRNPRPRYLVGGRDVRIAAMVARLPYRLRYRLTAARP